MNTKRRSTARKSKGTKSKKPKFLSLRLQFPTDETNQIKQSGNPHTAAAAAATADTSSDQPNPISLRSEHPSEERESNDHENVEFYFSAAADGVAATLTGLLDAAESNSSHANDSSSRLDYPSPASLTQAYGEERAALVRNALRSRDRDSSEEKWVCYSEVVKEEEVTSSAVDPAGIRRMSLKLDYEEIMNAWSDRGPLYIDNSQIVPDINHLFLSHEPPGHYDGLNMGCNVGSWIVPEMVGDIEENGEMMISNNNPRRMNERDDEMMKMMGQREASVLRYKEKRQNRLFSKKIRYQVRKLNAEKRPRLKGRFVKRD